MNKRWVLYMSLGFTAWRSTPLLSHRQALRALRHQYRDIADARPFREHDHVLLQPLRDRSPSLLFRGPLRPGKRIETHKGTLLHDEILGKRVRDVVQVEPLKSGKPASEFRLLNVTMDDYVRLSRRLVTPIYPADANLIVSLMDLHPEAYAGGSDDIEPRLEILEAGTGHGALTLHLSRAIHAANPPKPRAPIAITDDPVETSLSSADRESRRYAVVHTIEILPRYSEHARKTIAAFRNGQYLDNINFHTGDVSDWVSSNFSARNNEPFLSHAFLDLPNADTHVDSVTKALRIDGTLIVFNPSITQITECALKIKRDGISLELDRVIELGVNSGSGGREWDVRPVVPRANVLAAANVDQEASNDSMADREAGSEGTSPASTDDGRTELQSDQAKWSMVCRPKVGDRVVGGGFLGVWKKRRV